MHDLPCVETCIIKIVEKLTIDTISFYKITRYFAGFEINGKMAYDVFSQYFKNFGYIWDYFDISTIFTSEFIKFLRTR